MVVKVVASHNQLKVKLDAPIDVTTTNLLEKINKWPLKIISNLHETKWRQICDNGCRNIL